MTADRFLWHRLRDFLPEATIQQLRAEYEAQRVANARLARRVATEQRYKGHVTRLLAMPVRTPYQDRRLARMQAWLARVAAEDTPPQA